MNSIRITVISVSGTTQAHTQLSNWSSCNIYLVVSTVSWIGIHENVTWTSWKQHLNCGSHSFFTENAWGHQAVWACVVQASLPENLSRWTRWLTDHIPRDVGSSSVKQHGQVTRTFWAISMPELQQKSGGRKVRSKCSDIFFDFLNYLLGLQKSVKNTSS